MNNSLSKQLIDLAITYNAKRGERDELVTKTINQYLQESGLDYREAITQVRTEQDLGLGGTCILDSLLYDMYIRRSIPEIKNHQYPASGTEEFAKNVVLTSKSAICLENYKKNKKII